VHSPSDLTILVFGFWTPSTQQHRGQDPKQGHSSTPRYLHSKTRRSKPPVTRYCPAGLKSTPQIPAVWPTSVQTHTPVVASQMRRVPSYDEVTTHRLSGENEMEMTVPLWGGKCSQLKPYDKRKHKRTVCPSQVNPCSTCPDERNGLTFQLFHVPSSPPLAIPPPSGRNATDITRSACPSHFFSR
jgi:hypothetical protein